MDCFVASLLAMTEMDRTLAYSRKTKGLRETIAQPFVVLT